MPTSAAPHSAGPVDVLRWAGRLVAGWWPLRPAMPTRQVQLYALVGILDDAVEAQPSADRAVDACSQASVPPSTAIEDAARQLSVYHHLMLRLRALRLPSDLQPLGEHASRLLSHHEWILHQTLTVARAPRSDERLAQARQELNGLGAAADDLRALRDDVQERAKGTWRPSEETS
ncbi:hypothetical protein ABZ890_43260 [Streptomyces sp. NPDC046984]|uniref:hypothetical protein n=1 Tax=Streptomyces sp. NPDC046984 TaxID=3155138 RepID=UPI0033F3356C